MKPAPFAYHRAETVDQAVTLLHELGDEAKLLAGGQSLSAMLNLRLARPRALIDLNSIRALSYILDDGRLLTVGALTRHRQLERYPAPLHGLEVLPQAAAQIGHYPIRTRGTFGGSIAHSDPASEWCLMARLLDAEIVTESVRGRRTYLADTFFRGYFDTALDPSEMIIEVRFPWRPTASAVAEFARRHGDFAIVAAAAAVQRDDAGNVIEARIALGGVDSTVVRAPAAEAMLRGGEVSAELIEEVAAAATVDLDPPTDLQGDGTYRRRLARSLVRRALRQAMPVSPATDTGRIHPLPSRSSSWTNGTTSA